jgi:hypothetical protein
VEDIWMMTDREKTDNPNGETSCGTSPGNRKTNWLVPVSLCLTAVVAVNIYIVWYLLYAIPYDCSNLMVRSGGNATCGIEPGAYLLSGISILIIIIAMYAFIRWNLKRCRNQKLEYIDN